MCRIFLRVRALIPVFWFHFALCDTCRLTSGLKRRDSGVQLGGDDPGGIYRLTHVRWGSHTLPHRLPHYMEYKKKFFSPFFFISPAARARIFRGVFR